MPPHGPDQDPILFDRKIQDPAPTLEERLRALGLGDLAEQGRRTATGEPRLTALGAELAALSATVAAQRVRINETERTLVERIADVDDDRRRTLSQVQRAIQTQSEEIQARLHRRGWQVALTLLLLAALVGAGVYLLQQRLAHLQSPLRSELGTLRQEVERLSASSGQDARVQEKLAALSAAVEEVSVALDALAEGERRRTASLADTPALSQRLDRLGAEQERLLAQIARLQESAQTAPGPALHTEPSAKPTPDQVKAPAAAAGAQATPEAEADRVDPDAAPAPAGEAGVAPESTPAPQAVDSAAPAAPPSEPAEAGASEPRPDTDPTEAGTSTPNQPESYALQLIGFYSQAKLRQLVESAPLPDQVYVREERVRGRPWFVLIHSLHGSYAQAQAALDALPAELARLAPWIRKLDADASLKPLVSGPAP